MRRHRPTITRGAPQARLCVGLRFALMSRAIPTGESSMSRLRMFLLLLLGLLATGVLISGCGNKGDLYLPDRAENPK